MRHIDLLEWRGYSLSLWMPEKTLLSELRRSIKYLMRDIRLFLPSRKLYPNIYYKKYCRKWHEKLNDWLCDMIFDRPKKYKERTGIAKFYSFITFFDDANGREVWNREQIKDAERSGQVMMTHREAEQEYKRNKRYRDEQFNRKSQKLFEEKLVKLNQGYSYARQFAGAEKFSREALQKHLESVK